MPTSSREVATPLGAAQFGERSRPMHSTRVAAREVMLSEGHCPGSVAWTERRNRSRFAADAQRERFSPGCLRRGELGRLGGSTSLAEKERDPHRCQPDKEAEKANERDAVDHVRGWREGSEPAGEG